MQVGGQRSDPATLTPERSSGTPCTGDWVSPGAGLDGRGDEERNKT
jgi:hypothetical protein